MTTPNDDTTQGGLTERGELLSQGLAALAVDGDDTLSAPEDQPTGTDDAAPVQADAEQTGEAETSDPAAAPAAGPADIPAPPIVETADADRSDVETRTEA
jgi:hypothetical protein